MTVLNFARLTAGSTLLLSGLVAGQAFAQESATTASPSAVQTPASASGAAADDGLTDIVVTA